MSHGAPIDWDISNGIIGSYSGKRLENPTGGWRKPPANVPLIKGPLYVYQGTPLPLANEMRPATIPEDSMFMFSHNVASPSCCPSTYSTDRGCVCTTQQQRDWIGVHRGGNRKASGTPSGQGMYDEY